MSYAFADLAPQYADLWASMKIDPGRVAEFGVLARRLFSQMPIYKNVSAATGVPPSVIAVIHERESGQDFTCHLHNGDKLTARTYHVPAGRPPPPAEPPFTWTASAIDALKYEGFDEIKDWPLEQAAYSLEAYNGPGYRRRGLRSPYLWGGTNQQQPGKYTFDGKFDPNAMDGQPGTMPLLYALWQLDRSLSLPLSKPVTVTPQPWDVTVWQFFPSPRLAWAQSILLAVYPNEDVGFPQDGLDGPRTQNLVRRFQRDRNLQVDGVIGPQTETALKAAFSQQQGA